MGHVWATPGLGLYHPIPCLSLGDLRRCQEMLNMAKEVTGSLPSVEWRRQENRGLWCKWCWYTTKSPSEHTGWGNHTHQRCWYHKQGKVNEEKARAEKEKAGAMEAQEEIQKMVDMSQRPAEPMGIRAQRIVDRMSRILGPKPQTPGPEP